MQAHLSICEVVCGPIANKQRIAAITARYLCARSALVQLGAPAFRCMRGPTAAGMELLQKRVESLSGERVTEQEKGLGPLRAAERI